MVWCRSSSQPTSTASPESLRDFRKLHDGCRIPGDYALIHRILKRLADYAVMVPNGLWSQTTLAAQTAAFRFLVAVFLQGGLCQLGELARVFAEIGHDMRRNSTSYISHVESWIFGLISSSHRSK